MNSTARLVCDNCLQSVEWEVSQHPGPPTLCPFCGGTIDSQLGALKTPTSDFTRPAPLETELRSDELNRWTETWNKGSLGTVGRFLLRELKGDGGFGQVYQAYDPRLDRDVALKVLKQANPGERVMQRFFREARAAARLEHPNIVGVLDAGCDGGRCWIAYQFVAGRTLARAHDPRDTDYVKTVRIVRDLADALDHAHRNGVYHRDLKPANVMIDAAGRPRLTDFGLAKRADLDSDLTRDGAIIGTPAYMPPEQAAGQSHLADARSDVYSLGVIFYELLCNRRPADAPTALAAKRPPTIVDPPLPRSIEPSIPRALERICLQALAADPNERHPNARALADDLNRWLNRGSVPSGVMHTLAGALLGAVCTLLLMLGIQSRQNGKRADAAHATQVAASNEVPNAQQSRISPPSPAITTQPAVALVGAESKETPVEIVPQPVIEPATPPHASPFVGNRDTKKFHLANCSTLAKMGATNRVPFRTFEAAVALNYKPCGTCQPTSKDNESPKD